MKKRILLCCCVILMFGLVACNGGNEAPTTATNPVEPYEEMIDDVNNQVSEDYENMDDVIDNLDEY